MRIAANWMQGAETAEEKARRGNLVEHSTATLDLLAAVSRIEISKLGTAPLSDYESPGWALKEADRKGQIRVWKNILLLCNHPDKET